MSTQISEKQEFKEKLDYLYEDKGISLVSIAETINTNVQKLRDIRKGRSSGNRALLKKLSGSYSEIFEAGNQPDLKEDMEQLKEEVEKMKKENMEMKNMLLKLQNELLTKKK